MCLEFYYKEMRSKKLDNYDKVYVWDVNIVMRVGMGFLEFSSS